MDEIFPKDFLLDAKIELDYNLVAFKNIDGTKWLKSQKLEYSQFSGEARKPPSDDFLKSIGYLIWCNSLYEVKIRRAIFWIECYTKNTIITLPGQRVPMGGKYWYIEETSQGR